MLGIIDLPTYIIGTIAIVLLPGPNSMFCLTVAAQFGVKKAYRAAAGIFIGDSVLMFLAAAGAASVMVRYPEVFHIIKYLGGAYLAYLGLKMLRGAVTGWRRAAEGSTPEATAHLHAPNVFARALLLSLLNPKAILFFVSFFVQFVDPHYAHPAMGFLLLAGILQCISLLYLSCLIFSGVHLVRWFRRRQKVAATGLASVGALFMGFAVKLWTATI